MPPSKPSETAPPASDRPDPAPIPVDPVPRDREMAALQADIRACRVCADRLPLGPRPTVRADRGASLLIVGQAPGTKVHATGLPWNDPSGDRLRDWLRMDRAAFYDPARVAIVPMGFCYPGRLPRGGDAPPRPECAPLWHAALLRHLPNVRLTLLVGQYAQTYYLPPEARGRTMTETVRRGPTRIDGLGDAIPLPHPSWRNTAWIGRNPWFETETLPALRAALSALPPR